MFQIDYRIGEKERERLLSERCDPQDFYVEANMLILFNEYSLGSSDLEHFWFGEMAENWLYCLNSAILLLAGSDYACHVIPETGDMAMEYFVDGDSLTMRHIRVELDVFIGIYCDAISDAPEATEIFRTESGISKKQFVRDVLKLTRRFIDEVYSINPHFSRLKPLDFLENVHEEAVKKFAGVLD